METQKHKGETHMNKDNIQKAIATAMMHCDHADQDAGLYEPDITRRMAENWINFTCDSKARSLCYACINEPYDPNHFNEVAEVHYDMLKDYWHKIEELTHKLIDRMI
jgi:hypothetical protein